MDRNSNLCYELIHLETFWDNLVDTIYLMHHNRHNLIFLILQPGQEVLMNSLNPTNLQKSDLNYLEFFQKHGVFFLMMEDNLNKEFIILPKT